MVPADADADDVEDVITGDGVVIAGLPRFGEGASTSSASEADIDLRDATLSTESVDSPPLPTDPSNYRDAEKHSEEDDNTAEGVEFPSVRAGDADVDFGDGDWSPDSTDDAQGIDASAEFDWDPGEFAEVEVAESVQTDVADDFFEDG